VDQARNDVQRACRSRHGRPLLGVGFQRPTVQAVGDKPTRPNKQGGVAHSVPAIGDSEMGPINKIGRGLPGRNGF
jgi:hypothetical protein